MECDLLQVVHSRLCVDEFIEHSICSLVGNHLRDSRLWVPNVAKHDRLSRTALLARRNDLSVTDVATFFERSPIFRITNALHAKGTLLHDAIRADGNVWVPLPGHRLRHIFVRVPIPVEDPNLIGAVVGTVSRADTTVVDLRVHTLWRVVRRKDRADRLARRIPTVLADHG